MAAKPPSVEIEVDNRVVRVSNPDRVYFPQTGATKLDLVDTIPAIALPYIASAFGIFLLRQTFKTVPRELEEEANNAIGDDLERVWKRALALH